MEKKREGLAPLSGFFKTPYGAKIREKLFDNLKNNSEIKELLRQESEPYNRLMANYKCALMAIETKFRIMDEEFSLQHDRNPIQSIKTRLKTLESTMEKMAKNNIPFSTESMEKEIYDIAGIRIICAFPDDIYFLVDCLLQQDDVTLVNRKDYIKNPKKNGYRSLHLIVGVPIFFQSTKKIMNVEVQFRTIAMDFWASLEHQLRYKKKINEKVDLAAIERELTECAEESASLDRRMNNIRKMLGY